MSPSSGQPRRSVGTTHGLHWILRRPSGFRVPPEDRVLRVLFLVVQELLYGLSLRAKFIHGHRPRFTMHFAKASAPVSLASTFLSGCTWSVLSPPSAPTGVLNPSISVSESHGGRNDDLVPFSPNSPREKPSVQSSSL